MARLPRRGLIRLQCGYQCKSATSRLHPAFLCSIPGDPNPIAPSPKPFHLVKTKLPRERMARRLHPAFLCSIPGACFKSNLPHCWCHPSRSTLKPRTYRERRRRGRRCKTATRQCYPAFLCSIPRSSSRIQSLYRRCPPAISEKPRSRRPGCCGWAGLRFLARRPGAIPRNCSSGAILHSSAALRRAVRSPRRIVDAVSQRSMARRPPIWCMRYGSEAPGRFRRQFTGARRERIGTGRRDPVRALASPSGMAIPRIAASHFQRPISITTLSVDNRFWPWYARA
jgi:hypothetical protein